MLWTLPHKKRRPMVSTISSAMYLASPLLSPVSTATPTTATITTHTSAALLLRLCPSSPRPTAHSL